MGPLTLPAAGSVYVDANAVICSVERMPTIVLDDLVSA